mmetsp:Transcript_37572/g.93031  ORF Transcript_37572/g.93031 Transcript_37572/m.93031 type:complete len:209 (+) Transcript_37572:1958-2584(+)
MPASRRTRICICRGAPRCRTSPRPCGRGGSLARAAQRRSRSSHGTARHTAGGTGAQPRRTSARKAQCTAHLPPPSMCRTATSACGRSPARRSRRAPCTSRTPRSRGVSTGARMSLARARSAACISNAGVRPNGTSAGRRAHTRAASRTAASSPHSPRSPSWQACARRPAGRGACGRRAAALARARPRCAAGPRGRSKAGRPRGRRPRP